MSDEQSYAGWAVAGVGTIVSTLSGLVAYFYKQQLSDFKAAESELKAHVGALTQRANDCETDRNELRVKCAVLEERVSAIEARVG